jgi:hypothetical protein
VVPFVNDNKHYEIFHTSTEYLGYPPVTLKPGQRFSCTFEMSLHLAGGTYYWGIVLYRFNIEKVLFRLFPAATVFVNSRADVHGIVNLHPKITAFGPTSEPGYSLQESTP